MNEQSLPETLDAAGYESRLVLANAIELGLRTMDRALGNHAASFFEGTEMTRAYRARLLAGKIKKHIMEGHVYGGEK